MSKNQKNSSTKSEKNVKDRITKKVPSIDNTIKTTIKRSTNVVASSDKVKPGSRTLVASTKPAPTKEKSDGKKVPPLTSKEKVAEVKPTKRTSTLSKTTKVETKPVARKVGAAAAAKPMTQIKLAEKSKAAPLKATYVPKKAPPVISDKNVMNTIHNVTVASPPPQRKEYDSPFGEAPNTNDIPFPKNKIEKNADFNVFGEVPADDRNVMAENSSDELNRRQRTKTRTLDLDEIVILKPQKDESSPVVVVVKEPIAFDIQFEEASVNKKLPAAIDVRRANESKEIIESIPLKSSEEKPSKIELRKSSAKEPEKMAKENTIRNLPEDDHVTLSSMKILPDSIPEIPPSPDASDYDYEEDFESYESDFESCSSKTTGASEESDIENSFKKDEEPDEDEEEDEEEEQHDSGNFEFKSQQQQQLLHVNDSIDDKDLSEGGQIDSGFGYSSTITTSESPPLTNLPTQSIMEPESSKTVKKLSKISQRGKDLMNKITLDTMTYSLFELKPINYEFYMKIYGHVNSTQNSTQTTDNSIDQDCQTDEHSYASVWTQFPPNFLSKNIFHPSYQQDRNGVGFEEFTNDEINKNDDQQLGQSLRLINGLEEKSQNLTASTGQQHKTTIDYNRLSLFLQKSAVTLSGIFTTPTTQQKLLQPPPSSMIPGSRGYFCINYKQHNLLRGTKIYQLFSNEHLSNLLYAMHEQDVDQHGDGSFLISIWNLVDPVEPLHILSSWSRYSCMEIQVANPDVVFAGSIDGSIAVWDLVESKYWHRSDVGGGGDMTVYIPTQIVVPSSSTSTTNTFFDYGSCVSIKSIPNINVDAALTDYNPYQICSLHEFGIVTIWTILPTSAPDSSKITWSTIKNFKIDHQSPWSKIKIIQSNSINLRDIVLTTSKRGKRRPKSGFDKTRSYFESNLFTDAALQELHEIDKSMTSSSSSDQETKEFRCTSFEFGLDKLFVATNWKFLIFGTKSLHQSGIKKVSINESNFIYSTNLRTIFDNNILLIGLSDGSVQILPFIEATGEPGGIEEEATKSNQFDETATFNAKSCAIQNIIKDEHRRSFDDIIDKRSFVVLNDSLQLEDQQNENDLEIVKFSNYKTLLHGLSLNQYYVRNIVHSKVTQNLYVHCGRNIRIFNLEKMSEIQCHSSNNGNCYDIVLTKGLHNVEYMTLLIGTEIQVHYLSNN